MGFWICESLPNGTIDLTTETRLMPGPTYPEYPERVPYTLQQTDSAPVIQRQKRPSDEYKWVWENYTPSVPNYETVYWYLFNNQYVVRLKAGKSPYVYLKDNVTGNFGKYNDVSKKIEPAYIKCLITYVGRTESREGGNVRYNTTEVRFIIDDPSIPEVL